MLKYVSKKRHHADSRICIWLQNHFITYITQCVCKIDINPTTFMPNKTLWHYSLLRKFEYILLISNHLIRGFRNLREQKEKYNPIYLFITACCVLKATLNTPNLWIKECILKIGANKTPKPRYFKCLIILMERTKACQPSARKKYPLFWLGGS